MNALQLLTQMRRKRRPSGENAAYAGTRANTMVYFNLGQGPLQKQREGYRPPSAESLRAVEGFV